MLYISIYLKNSFIVVKNNNKIPISMSKWILKILKFLMLKHSFVNNSLIKTKITLEYAFLLTNNFLKYCDIYNSNRCWTSWSKFNTYDTELRYIEIFASN